MYAAEHQPSIWAPALGGGTRTGHTKTVAVAPPADIELAALGRTTRAAHDRLLREFQRQGWRDDDDAAEAIIGILERRGGRASRRAVVAAVPRDFLYRNQIRRADVERLIARLGKR